MFARGMHPFTQLLYTTIQHQTHNNAHHPCTPHSPEVVDERVCSTAQDTRVWSMKVTKQLHTSWWLSNMPSAPSCAPCYYSYTTFPKLHSLKLSDIQFLDSVYLLVSPGLIGELIQTNLPCLIDARRQRSEHLSIVTDSAGGHEIAYD